MPWGFRIIFKKIMSLELRLKRYASMCDRRDSTMGYFRLRNDHKQGQRNSNTINFEEGPAINLTWKTV